MRLSLLGYTLLFRAVMINSCPVCGGELVEKEVEKVLKGGGRTTVLKVRADVCIRCGERLYSSEVVKRFERVRRELECE